MPKKSTPHTRLRELFAKRLESELSITVLSYGTKGCGWNQKGVMPAPHVYRMVFTLYAASLTARQITAVQKLWNECLLQNDPPMSTIPIRVPGSNPPVRECQPLHFDRYGILHATVCTQDYLNNRAYYDQKARDDYHEKVARKAKLMNDPEWRAAREAKLEREALKVATEFQRLEEAYERRRALMTTLEFVQSRIEWWRTNHGLLPAMPHPHEDHIIVWKHVVQQLRRINYDTWFGEMGAPHRVGERFRYSGEGNACCGPYGALKRSPMQQAYGINNPNLLPDTELTYGGYVAAIAVRPIEVGIEGPYPVRSSVLIDHHSEGVVTFKSGLCLAVYHGTIDNKTQELTLKLIDGEDVLPLIQPTIDQS